MKLIASAVLLLVLAPFTLASGTDDLLQYDDGTADWFSFEGEHRGTWFNLEDFYPAVDASGFVLNYAEIWFFHVYTNPWDTSDFTGEITDGTPESPGTVFAHNTGTAVHLSASYIYPMGPCTTGTDFTVTEIPEFSLFGAPSIASDVSPATNPRSFTSSTSGIINYWQYDFLVRVNGYPLPSLGLARTTWASLKATFNCMQ